MTKLLGKLWGKLFIVTMPLSLIASNWLNMLSTVLWELTTQRVAYFIVEGLTSLFCFVYFLTSSHLGFLFFLLQQQFPLGDLNTDQKINTIIIRLVVYLFLSFLVYFPMDCQLSSGSSQFCKTKKKQQQQQPPITSFSTQVKISWGKLICCIYCTHCQKVCLTNKLCLSP